MKNGNISNNDVSNAEPSLMFIPKRQSTLSKKPDWLCGGETGLQTAVFRTKSFSTCLAERTSRPSMHFKFNYVTDFLSQREAEPNHPFRKTTPVLFMLVRASNYNPSRST